MKKLFTSALAIAALTFTAKSQVVVYSNDFSNIQNEQFQVADLDGDGEVWGALNFAQVQVPFLQAQGVALVSFSWDPETETPLTPDNLIISPAINISAVPAGTTLTFKWKVAAIDPQFFAENYSVYFVSEATQTSIATAIVSGPAFTETLTAGGQIFNRQVDISSFAGQPNIHFVLRHHDCTDQFVLVIDDVVIERSSSASVAENNFINVNVFPNPVSSVLNFEFANSDTRVIEVIDMTGKVVARNIANNSIETLDLSFLNNGVYVYRISNVEGALLKTAKFTVAK
jgi:hypothetical protein